jgi:feruloyl esterase
MEPSSDSEIKIEVWLSSEGWNGKFQAVGNGNWAGIINYPAMADALAAGYATSSTDTGHEGMNARFALGHPEKLVDYAYRSIHEMTVQAKAIIEAFYGRAPVQSYFNGRSTGGRYAIMEAERYPADFDGIVAGSIANPKTHLDAWRIASAQVMLKTPEGTIPREMFAMIHKAVLASCDALDGLTDGLIDDPRQCRFDARTIECKTGDSAASCLSPAQVASARALMAPLRNSAGAEVFPGYAPGTELGWVAPGGPLDNALEQYKYVVFADADWDWHTFELERDLARAERIGRGTLAPISPDLTAFAQRGGKLLMYHGWADPAIPGQATVDYYMTALATSKAPDTNRSWVTLFMVQGMDHGVGTGEGPNEFDMTSPLVGDDGKAAEPRGGVSQDWRAGGSHPAAVRLSAGGPVHGIRQYRRCRKFRVSYTVEPHGANGCNTIRTPIPGADLEGQNEAITQRWCASAAPSFNSSPTTYRGVERFDRS